MFPGAPLRPPVDYPSCAEPNYRPLRSGVPPARQKHAGHGFLVPSATRRRSFETYSCVTPLMKSDRAGYTVYHNSTQDPLQLALERRIPGQTDHPIDLLAGLEINQRWDTHNAIAAEDLRVIVGIQLYHQGAPLELACQLLHSRCDHVARTAPLSPEVHHRRRFRLQYNLVEFLTRQVT